MSIVSKNCTGPLYCRTARGGARSKTKEFETMLAKRTGLEVILVDERFTTAASEEELREMGVKTEYENRN